MTTKKVRIIGNEDNIPTQAVQGAAGLDVVAKSAYYNYETRSWTYSTGVKVEIPEGYFLDVRARSSIKNSGPWVLANGCGVVDPGYQGEIMLTYRCVDTDWDAASDPPYAEGDRCGQILLVPHVTIKWDHVEEFTEKTPRGEGGHGSTGKKRSKK
jgi:dUTP pyrophosphatase